MKKIKQREVYIVQTAIDLFDGQKLKWNNLFVENKLSDAKKDLKRLKNKEVEDREKNRKKFKKLIYQFYYKIEKIEFYY